MSDDKVPQPVPIRVIWLSAAEGGRRTGPPSGPTYWGTAVLVLGRDEEVNPGWPASGEHHSLRLDFLGEGRYSAAFLAPELAEDLVRPGAELLLMEGPRTVGRAVVLPDDES